MHYYGKFHVINPVVCKQVQIYFILFILMTHKSTWTFRRQNISIYLSYVTIVILILIRMNVYLTHPCCNHTSLHPIPHNSFLTSDAQCSNIIFRVTATYMYTLTNKLSVQKHLILYQQFFNQYDVIF